MAITETTYSKTNLITEAAGNNLNFVINDMNHKPDEHPPALESMDAYLDRFATIKDLNVISATGEDHLKTSPEFKDRYPVAAFFIDQTERQGDDVHFQASLGLRIEVQGETFAMAQRELNEIGDACRAIIHMDRSFGELGKRGGVIDTLEYQGATDANFTSGDMGEHIMGMTFFYNIWYNEQVIR